jgi:protease-4
MKKLFRGIGYVFSGFWRGLTVCRVILGNLIFLVLIVIVLSIFFHDPEESFPEQAALVLSLRGDIVEQKTQTMLASSLLGEPDDEEILLKDVINVIDHAADDPRVQALFLDLRDLGRVGISKMLDIGDALKRFKDSQKPVYAYGEFFDQRSYFMATYADQINMHPMGAVFLTGFGLYRNYYKTALEKLMVQFHVFRVGTYKSALEPFLRDEMSDYAREANLSWLTVLWDAYKANVANLRNLAPEDIDTYVNSGPALLARAEGDDARLALDYGLVDALKTRDEIRDDLIRLVGENEEEKTFNQIQFGQYLAAVKPELEKVHPNQPRVAIIVAQGIILNGNQPKGRIGGDSLTELIRRARRDDKVKAVVLRIDSPGGNAMASDIIRRELEVTRDAGLPVVVSMSSVAASGGYWIASVANEIWAAPTTITGSIGIYSAFPTLDKSLDYLGIHNDGVGTTQLADAFNTARPLNPILADLIEQTIQHGYSRFINTVSEGRNMPPHEVEKIAQGRVWAGITAKEIGLVDGIGNLQDAVGSAAELANLNDYEVVYVKQPLTAREEMIRRLNRFLAGIFNDIQGNSRSRAVRMVQQFGIDLEPIMELNDPKGLYAYCLTCDLN